MNISAQFGSYWPSAFGEKDFNVKSFPQKQPLTKIDDNSLPNPIGQVI